MRQKKVSLTQYWPWIIFLIAISLRLALLCAHDFKLGWEGDGFPKSDARTYDVLAMNILNGRGFGVYRMGFKFSSSVSPIYPLFLAFIYSFFGHNYMAVKIVQLVIGSLNAVLVYAIGKRLFTRNVGIISGLIFACYIPHMWWTSALMRELFSTFVFALTYLAMIKAIDESSLKNCILAGISIGIAILTRGQALVFLPVLVICGLIGRIKKQHFLILLFALLTISPWLIRSMIVHNGAIIMESSVARQFRTGADPGHGGFFYSRGSWHEILWDKPFQSEAERYRRLTGEGIRFIKENPQKYFGFFKARFRRFWHVHRLEIVSFDFKGIEMLLPYMITFFGFIGAAHAFFLAPRSAALILIALLYSIGSGVCGSLTRYRLPLEQFLIIFTAYTIYLVSQIRSRDWRRPQLFAESGDKNDRFPEKPVPLGFQTGLAKFLKVCGILLVLIFTIRLCIAYWGPGERIVEPQVSEEEIQLALKKHNLLTIWEEQSKKLIYQDIFLDQAQNHGYVTRYDGAIVIWKGMMEYIIKDANGNIKHFGFVLNPSPHDFGEEAFGVSPARGIKVKAGKFKGGDIAFIIARIKTTGKVLGDPGVEFYEILR